MNNNMEHSSRSLLSNILSFLRRRLIRQNNTQGAYADVNSDKIEEENNGVMSRIRSMFKRESAPDLIEDNSLSPDNIPGGTTENKKPQPGQYNRILSGNDASNESGAMYKSTAHDGTMPPEIPRRTRLIFFKSLASEIVNKLTPAVINRSKYGHIPDNDHRSEDDNSPPRPTKSMFGFNIFGRSGGSTSKNKSRDSYQNSPEDSNERKSSKIKSS